MKNVSLRQYLSCLLLLLLALVCGNIVAFAHIPENTKILLEIVGIVSFILAVIIFIRNRYFYGRQ
jgi:hypothetical protein